MDRALPKRLASSGKLTAPTFEKRSPEHVILQRRVDAPHSLTTNCGDSRESLRAQLRDRLLSMILENERIRRNEKRVSAG